MVDQMNIKRHTSKSHELYLQAPRYLLVGLVETEMSSFKWLRNLQKKKSF